MATNTAGQYSVPAPIRQRAEELYPQTGTAEPAIRTRGVGGRSTIDALINVSADLLPGIGPAIKALNMGRNVVSGDKSNTNSSLADPFGIDPRKRTDEIDKLINKEGFLETFDPSTNTYDMDTGPLSTAFRRNITSDDITNRVLKLNKNNIQESDEYRLLLNDPSRGKAWLQDFITRKGGSYMDGHALQVAGASFADRKAALTAISDVDGGGKILDAARVKAGLKPGEELSVAQLKQVLADANENSPKGQRALETHNTSINASKESVLASQSNREVNTQSIASAKARTLLDSVNAENSQRIAEAEIDYKNSVAGYEHNIAQRQQDMDWESGSLDRNLRKDLAILGLEDKQTDREYDDRRDERSNRQMMIMQLMKGLQGFGQSVGGY